MCEDSSDVMVLALGLLSDDRALVIGCGATLEQACQQACQFTMYGQQHGELSPSDYERLYDAAVFARPPSDGLLGTVVSVTLQLEDGLQVYVQAVSDVTF